MANIDFNKKHLTPHRRRMIEGFVSCTREIIDSDGYDGVTIRKIADCTNLNSATIYNYFENVDHLMFFAIMNCLDDYIKDLPNWVKEGDDPLVVYKQTWRAFVKHAFEQPEGYKEIFFSEMSKEKNYYIHQYYKIFPIENKGFPAYLDKMLTANTLEERNEYQIEVCKNVGYFDKESAENVNLMLTYIFEGLLRRVARGDLNADAAYADFEKYLNIIVDTQKLK